MIRKYYIIKIKCGIEPIRKSQLNTESHFHSIAGAFGSDIHGHDVL